MELTINSKKLGKKLTFSRPGAYYVYIDTNGKSGSLGMQICHGGGFHGSTIGATDGDFKYVCRKWYRQYLKN